MHLVPIKVKIGLRRVRIRIGSANLRSEADHPDWFLVALPTNGEHLRGDGDHPDDFVLGSWHYDKSPGGGHQENNHGDSPMFMQWGMRLCTPQFAVNAVATFPDTMSIMTEFEASGFYDDRAYAHLPDTEAAGPILTDLKAEFDLRMELGHDVTELKAKIERALDPDDPEPGIRWSPAKYWSQHCESCEIEIEEPLTTKERIPNIKE